MWERLQQILAERAENHAAYEQDGWKYFDEFAPVLYAYFFRRPTKEENPTKAGSEKPKPAQEPAKKPPISPQVQQKVVKPRKVAKKRK